MSQLLKETKKILKQYGIYANKNLGQNFLINEQVIEQIISSADIKKEDLVIEIGPGLGTLTKRLLECAGKVIAIELDKKMVQILEDRFTPNQYQQLELINEDILKVDLQSIIHQNIENNSHHADPSAEKIKKVKIVANLPYYITTPIIMKLLEGQLLIESITVMIQKEVADRLIANPGTKLTGAITYAVHYYAEPRKVIDVPNSSFIPEPNVTSSVIQLNLRKQPPVQVKDEKLMFHIIKQAFMQRRKTLVNALSNTPIFQSKEQISNILKEMGIDEKVRGEALSLEQFANITNQLIKL